MTDVRDAFLRAACAPRTGSHAGGDLAEARQLLDEHPSLRAGDVHVSAAIGDASAIRACLAADPTSATRRTAPYDWDPLTTLCFSRFLRLDQTAAEGFTAAAAALLEAGANANTGFFEPGHTPTPVFESVLYGAAGVAHHEGVTRLLLAHGADPNDDEVPYHAPEGYALGAFKALLESPRLTTASLSTMLLRKSDWHDLDGMRLVLERGADPNAVGHWGSTPLRHAIRSDNRTAIVALLLDSGADPRVPNPIDTPYALAAWAGRDDLLGLFDARALTVALDGLDALVAACARNDTAAIARLLATTPSLRSALTDRSAELLTRFAGVGNIAGLGALLDAGCAIDAATLEPNGYFELAAGTTALHAAAWRGHHRVVDALLVRGAAPDRRDRAGRTALMLAVKACVASYWVDERRPDSVRALLAAGASTDGVPHPCGYAPVDALLAAAAG